MATKKPSKKTARVQLDADTVHKFEEHLRDGLVASGAVIATENKTPKLKAGAKVELDPETTASLSKALQKGLVSSSAVIATELAKFSKAKSKGKGKTKSKGYSPKPAAKKR
jgi:hypothetical protein